MPTSDPNFFHTAARAAARVTELTVLVILGTWGGSQLDERLDTSPWLLLAGASVGTAAGMYRLALGFQEQAPHDE